MPTHPRVRPRHAVTTALALVALTWLTLASAPPAAAHDTLVASTPAADENLDSAPAELVLTFSGDVLDVGAEVLLTGPDGEHRSVPSVTDGVVTTALPDLPVGHYDARWRVVSEDGHPISGIVPFSIGDAGPRPEPTTAPSTSPTPTDVDAAAPTDAGTPATTSPAVAPGPLRPLGVAAIGALAALAVLATVRAVRRRRHPHHPSQEIS
ncbi:copper resistance protein CopC [Serinibacter arcticus]|uniref:Copper resistance protein CopC n=1 Tax=Serinibacter arcticus TaxID=1655435 RepID=A0A2U1ZV55_9MICO|nr:copper resistance CopC family protein [Serinibacter arcticus]PWD50802.1 copper resistance protein CopC [Serinibacter arcticus]